MIRIALVEDHAAARRNLIAILTQLLPQATILWEASSVAEAREHLNQATPELLFLDVELPDGKGFDVLNALPHVDFSVIFTTSHEQYALQAIKYSAVDYLLKPLDPDEVEQAIDRARVQFSKEDAAKKMKVLLQNTKRSPDDLGKLALRDKYGIQIVALKDVIRLEANGGYTTFHVDGAHPIMVSKTLKEYSQLLPETHFFRCHQSHLVQLEYLQRYDKREGDLLILTDGSRIPLALRKRDALLKILQVR